MTLSKRERVIRTLELEEPDKCPIYYLGFEPTASTYQEFLRSTHFEALKITGNSIEDSWLKGITQYRFLNADIASTDPFIKTKPVFRFFDMARYKKTNDIISSIGEPISKIGDYLSTWRLPKGVFYINVASGRLWEVKSHEKTGLPYRWFIKGLFSTPEIVQTVWKNFGKPSEMLCDGENFNPQIWERFVKILSPYLYPMANLWGSAMHEFMVEGMGFGTVAYLMRKNPDFIHYYMAQHTKLNIELIKKLSDAGVDIVHYWDDLGQKGRSILSLKNFKEFILPYYRKMFQECRKRGMFIVQHSDGYIDELLPDMVEAGLNCIQSLEPTAGVNLSHLKETLGDRVAFMGGMDSSRLLNFGTPEEIEADVKRCIKIGGKGGGYFAGPSHNILDCPLTNLLILRAAIDKYRTYPIHF